LEEISDKIRHWSSSVSQPSKLAALVAGPFYRILAVFLALDRSSIKVFWMAHYSRLNLRFSQGLIYLPNAERTHGGGEA
jgi:hypothetical protein